MDKFSIEFLISPPFLERNIAAKITKQEKITNSSQSTEPNSDNESNIESYNKENISFKHEFIPSRLCSSAYILGIKSLDNSELPDSLHIKGFQQNCYTRTNFLEMEIDFQEGINKQIKRIITFSCLDITELNIIAKFKKDKKMYKCTFSGCNILRNPNLYFHKVKLFQENKFLKIKKDPSYLLEVKVLNYKSRNFDANLHYNWSESFNNQISSSCKINVENVDYELENIFCIFCFKQFTNLENLKFHINFMHFNFSAEIIISHPKNINEENKNIDSKDQILVIRRINKTISQKKRSKKKNIFANFFIKQKKRIPYSIKEEISCIKSKNKILEFDYKKIESDTKYFFCSKSLNEILGLKDRIREMMIKWNNFIFLNKNIENKFQICKNFVMKLKNRKNVFDFLNLMHQKGILMQSQVFEIIDERSKK